MKRLLPYILAAISSIGFSQNSITLPIENNPLPTDTLRVLMIGNSFTDDVTEYIGSIVKYSGIDETKCCVYRVTQGGSSLQTWRDKYKNNTNVKLERKAGLLSMVVTEGCLKEVIHQNWDVISLQQLSNNTGDITTFSPYLEELLSYIKKDCLNKDLAICWHLTWSYWNEHTASGPKEYVGWTKIVSTVDAMIQKYGVNLIIPSGTAIQNARSTILNTEKSLTRDGYHMDLGIGRYIIACTLYESLFAPVFSNSIIQNSWHPEAISDQMANIAKNCAIQAVSNWNKTTDIAETIDAIKPKISVSPNPTTDYLYVVYDSNKEDSILCFVVNMKGKIVYRERITTNQTVPIDLTKVKRGIYSIILESEDGIISQRIEKL